MKNYKTTTNITIENNASLPEGYLAHGYKTAEGKCDRRYVDSFAIEIAKKLAPMEKEFFRTFYAELLYKERCSIDEKQKLVRKLTTNALKAVKKGCAPEIFYEFMKRNAENITDHKAFVDFTDHMECIYCYMD